MLRILSIGSARADSSWRTISKRWLSVSSVCARISRADSPEA